MRTDSGSVDGEDQEENEDDEDGSDEEMEEDEDEKDKDGDVEMDAKPKAHDPNDLSAFKMDEYDNEESTGVGK
jgi:periodic tryptophan protein 1